MKNNKYLSVFLYDEKDKKILTPEVLQWNDNTGIGHVWVNEDNALMGLDAETFKISKTWGELRIEYDSNNNSFRLTPLEGDNYKRELLSWPE